MGKIATAAAGLALMMSQAAFAQEQPASTAAVSQSAADPAAQTDSATTAQAGNRHDGFRRTLPFRDPRVIAAALAALSIATIGIIFATDGGRSHHPASP